MPAKMPANDMVVTAQWTKNAYNVVSNAAEHSTVTNRTVSESGKYDYQSEVEVVLTVEEGYELATITAKTGEGQEEKAVALYDQ